MNGVKIAGGDMTMAITVAGISVMLTSADTGKAGAIATTIAGAGKKATVTIIKKKSLRALFYGQILRFLSCTICP